jgi:hypothetical protein
MPNVKTRYQRIFFALAAMHVDKAQAPCCGGDPERRIPSGGHGFEGSTPTEVCGKIFVCDPMEASHPLFEAPVVGVDVVEVELRFFGLGMAGRVASSSDQVSSAPANEAFQSAQ